MRVGTRPASDARMQGDGGGAGSEQLEARYANYFEVGHNAVEFVVDFGQLYPDSERARVHTRIVTSPTYAKALLDTLRLSIARFEQEYGDL
jgi:hypothetical protein